MNRITHLSLFSEIGGLDIAAEMAGIETVGQCEGVAVMLIPARTDTKAFHEYILGKGEIRFIRGRIKFGGAKFNAPFPSMIVVYDGR